MTRHKTCNLWHLLAAFIDASGVAGRRFHSSTFWLNVSAFCGTRGAWGLFTRYLWRGWWGCLGVYEKGMFCVSEMAQVELRSGRV